MFLGFTMPVALKLERSPKSLGSRHGPEILCRYYGQGLERLCRCTVPGHSTKLRWVEKLKACRAGLHPHMEDPSQKSNVPTGGRCRLKSAAREVGCSLLDRGCFPGSGHRFVGKSASSES